MTFARKKKYILYSPVKSFEGLQSREMTGIDINQEKKFTNGIYPSFIFEESLSYCLY